MNKYIMNKNERVDALIQNITILLQAIKLSNNEEACLVWLNDLEEDLEDVKRLIFKDLFVRV